MRVSRGMDMSPSPRMHVGSRPSLALARSTRTAAASSPYRSGARDTASRSFRSRTRPGTERAGFSVALVASGPLLRERAKSSVSRSRGGSRSCVTGDPRRSVSGLRQPEGGFVSIRADGGFAEPCPGWGLPWGGLIQTSWGAGKGEGRPLGKRSGWAAYAASRTRCRRVRAAHTRVFPDRTSCPFHLHLPPGPLL